MMVLPQGCGEDGIRKCRQSTKLSSWQKSFHFYTRACAHVHTHTYCSFFLFLSIPVSQFKGERGTSLPEGKYLPQKKDSSSLSKPRTASSGPKACPDGLRRGRGKHHWQWPQGPFPHTHCVPWLSLNGRRKALLGWTSCKMYVQNVCMGSCPFPLYSWRAMGLRKNQLEVFFVLLEVC